MILSRLGNKRRIATDIIQHFPQHKTFVDMFFGAGGLFFNKPLSEHNICNDIDDDIFNLWQVVQSDRVELIKQLQLLPISERIFKYYKNNKETDPVKKAVRFLFLSNFGYMGESETLLFGCANEKGVIESRIEKTFVFLSKVRFMCCDFKDVFSKLKFRSDSERLNTLIYADPPYLGTTNNYQQGFKEQDTIDLFSGLVDSKIRFALSEFDHPSVLELAKHHNLEVITIGERQNMKNRRTEILVVNYQSPALYSLFRNQEHSLSLV